MKYLVYGILLLFIVNCNDINNELVNSNSYEAIPVEDTSFVTISINEMELEIPKHLKFSVNDIGDYESFNDTTLDIFITTYQNMDTIENGNARSDYRELKYPDSLTYSISIEYTQDISTLLNSRVDTNFIDTIISKIKKSKEIESPSSTILNLSTTKYNNFIIIDDEMYNNYYYLKRRTYFLSNKIFRVICFVGNPKNNIDYKNYKPECDKVINSVRFVK